MRTLLGLALLAPGVAHAGSCPDPDVDEAGIKSELARVEEALEGADLPVALQTLSVVGENLPCLDAAISTDTFARFASLMSTVAFYRQDEAMAVRWGNAADLADDDIAWPVPDDHPLIALLEEAVEPPVGRADGFGLAAPAGGGILMNGELVLEPKAHAEVPFLVQVLDARGAVVGAYWQDGAAFPEQILVAGGGPYPRPSWYVDGAVRPVGKTPRDGGGEPFPVVPAVVGGGLAVTSVLTYIVAGSAQASLPDQTSADGLTAARSKANAFTLVSGLAAAGAVGVGVGGVLLSPDGVRVHVRF